jgi:hypothetical protein
MAKTRRKQPKLSEKLAATLLMLSRVDEHDELVPVIPREEAKRMTAAEIIGRFEFDHGIYVATPFNGDNHPTNLTPRIKAAHREKTKRDLKNIAKVRRSEKRKDGKAKPKATMQYTRMKATHKRTFEGKTVLR